MVFINKNYKKCPLKKRPVVYEEIERTDNINIHRLLEEQPHDLSLKRTSSERLEKYEPQVKCEFGLNLSNKRIKIELPKTVASEQTVMISPPEYLQSSNTHQRCLTPSSANWTANPLQRAFVMAAGCNPITAFWNDHQQQRSFDWNAVYPSPASSVQSCESFHNYSYQQMTPPSSPGSEDLASEPEDLSIRSDIPLPALFHQFEETASYSAISPVSSSYQRASLPPQQAYATSPKNRHFKCEKCNRMYATEKGLEKHQVFHCPGRMFKEKQQFSCGECGKTYTSNGALKMHIKTHTLPCKCNVCNKAFSRPWLLQGHLRTHTGEKPFACSVCPRRFADRSNLRAHQQTHVEIKKYQCNECKKSFSRASLLKKHSDSTCSISIA